MPARCPGDAARRRLAVGARRRVLAVDAIELGVLLGVGAVQALELVFERGLALDEVREELVLELAAQPRGARASATSCAAGRVAS